MQKLISLSFSLLLLAAFSFAAPYEGKAATKQAGKKCSMSKCGDSCPVRGMEVTKTEKNATVTGKILCAHCDLHSADKCEKVLVTAEKRVYHFCPDTLGDVKIDTYQGKKIKVKGTVHEFKEGDPAIHFSSIEKI